MAPTLSMGMQADIAILNLVKMNGRKKSVDGGGGSPKIRSGMSLYGKPPSSEGQLNKPFLLDRTQFETSYTFDDSLDEKDFRNLRNLVAKRKE